MAPAAQCGSRRVGALNCAGMKVATSSFVNVIMASPSLPGPVYPGFVTAVPCAFVFMIPFDMPPVCLFSFNVSVTDLRG